MKITKDIQKQINITMRELNIDRDSRNINHIRIHPTEGFKHFKLKCEACWDLYQENKPFLCEAFANNRKQKFDVVNLIDNEVVEIVIKSDTNREKIPAKVTKIYGTERDD